MSIFHTSRRRAIALVAAGGRGRGGAGDHRAIRRRRAQRGPGAQAHDRAGARRVRRVVELERLVIRLQLDGYPVIADANPLRGLGSDANYVRSVMEAVTGPIVLVGHSYGGSVITNAARGNPNVRALVYIAGFAPDRGRKRPRSVEQVPRQHAGPRYGADPARRRRGSAGTPGPVPATVRRRRTP